MYNKREDNMPKRCQQCNKTHKLKLTLINELFLCKLCYAKAYYIANRNKIKTYTKAHYHNNKEHYSYTGSAWLNRNNKKTSGRNHLLARLSTKYRFYQSFLKIILNFSDDDSKKLVQLMIELSTLTKKQRQVLFMLKQGLTTQEIADQTDRIQPTINKILNGSQMYTDDEVKFNGGINKKIKYIIHNFITKNEDLKMLLNEYKLNYPIET